MTFEILAEFTNALLEIASALGYFGVFFLMVIESSFIPFPSEVVLIPAGALVARGEMSFSLVLFFSILGSIIGALLNYFLAMFLGRNLIDKLIKKYGKVFLIDSSKLKKVDSFFVRHGEITTFTGRLIPVVRQLISLPAGFAKMDLPKFIAFTAIGAGIWSAILIYLGYALGSNLTLIKGNLSSLTFIVFILVLLILIIYLLKGSRNLLSRQVSS